MSEPVDGAPADVTEQAHDEVAQHHEELSKRATAAKARERARGNDGPAYTDDEKHLLHEVLTMALYVSLSLMAVLIASPDSVGEDHRWQEGMIVLGTGLALVLAHVVAFRMSTRLVNEGELTGHSRELIKAQAIGGLPVAVVAALPVFVLGEDPGEFVAELLLLFFVLGVGYRTARYSANRFRSFLYVGIVFLVVLGVVTVKLVVGH